MLYTPPSPSALTLITSAALAGAAAADFTSAITSAYDDYVFELVNVVHATAATALYVRTSADGGASWDAGASDYLASSSVTGAQISIYGNNGKNTEDFAGVCGFVRLFSPANAARSTVVWSSLTGPQSDAGGSPAVTTMGGRRNVAAVVNGVRFLPSAGLFLAGTIRLYGLANQ